MRIYVYISSIIYLLTINLFTYCFVILSFFVLFFVLVFSIRCCCLFFLFFLFFFSSCRFLKLNFILPLTPALSINYPKCFASVGKQVGSIYEVTSERLL